jgi:hypothetical protein
MSKLNPQKASAYVGPGVLRKGGKITPVPNGPLIKKKGPYAGSTLKSGGKIKKAQGGEYLTKEGNTYTSTKKVKTKNGPRYYQGKSPSMSFAMEIASDKARKINDSIPKAKLSARALEVMNNKNGGTMKKKAMMGSSMSKDNPIYKKTTKARGMIGNMMGIPGKPIVKNGNTIKKAQRGVAIDKTAVKKPRVRGKIKNEPTYKYADKIVTPTKKDSLDYKKGFDFGKSQPKNTLQGIFENPAWSIGNLEGRSDKRPEKKINLKSGGLIKRADGSYSKRGLWDNIRANKGSGKKPTKQMLQQEKKIKAKSKK